MIWALHVSDGGDNSDFCRETGLTLYVLFLFGIKGNLVLFSHTLRLLIGMGCPHHKLTGFALVVSCSFFFLPSFLELPSVLGTIHFCIFMFTNIS